VSAEGSKGKSAGKSGARAVPEEWPPPPPVAGPRGGPGSGPFLVIAFVVSCLLIGATLFTLRDILVKGRIEQWMYVFEDARLMPAHEVEAPGPEATVRIFYEGPGGALTPYVHRLRRDLQPNHRERFVLERIFSPPPHPRFRSAIPEGTQLRAFYVLERSAYVDVSKEFLEAPEPSARGERLAVYALVNGIVLNSREVDTVQILVEGRPVASAWGWMDCSTPLGANLSVIQ
jgi:hypothetical protein